MLSAAGWIVGAVAACLAVAAAAAPDAAEVTLDARRGVVGRFVGFGVQWDPYEYVPTEAAWRETLRRMDFMRPALIRVMGGAGAYCLGFAADGEPEYIWTRGDEAVRTRLGTLLWILDYARRRRIPVMLGEWAPPGRLGDGPHAEVGSPDHPRWARIIADFVRWLRVERGYSNIRMYNMMNEPNGGWMWPGGRVNYGAWAAGIRSLRRELDARGLADLPIVGPDNSWSWEWIDRVSRTMPESMGGYEMHWYATDREVLEGRIEALLTQKRAVVAANDPRAADKPLFMGEVGLLDGKTNGDQQPRVRDFAYGVFMADLAAQVGRAGWQGAIAWDLDDAMHSANGHAVPPNEKTLKLWGFWNTQGTAMGRPEDEAIRPWFAPWSLLCRLFPRGARIVAADQPTLPGLRVLATATATGRVLAVMIVNNSDEARTVTLRLAGGAKLRLYQYRYFVADRPVTAAGFPAPAGPPAAADLGAGYPVDLPGRGVVFLSTSPAR